MRGFSLNKLRELGARFSYLLLFVVPAVLLVVVFAAALIGIFVPEWTAGRARGSDAEELSYGLSERPSKLPPVTARKAFPYKNCSTAKALAGNVIALSECQSPNASGVVILDADAAPVANSFGTAAKDALSLLLTTKVTPVATKVVVVKKVAGKKSKHSETRVASKPASAGEGVSCDSAGSGRSRCRVGTVDLGESLIKAGLASSIFERTQDAENDAKAAGAGIWWDWKSTGRLKYDPVVWRGERDSVLSSAMSTHWQAVTSLYGGGLTLLAAALSGVVFSRIGERYRRSQTNSYIKGQITPEIDALRSIFAAIAYPHYTPVQLETHVAELTETLAQLKTKVSDLGQIAKPEFILMHRMERLPKDGLAALVILKEASAQYKTAGSLSGLEQSRIESAANAMVTKIDRFLSSEVTL